MSLGELIDKLMQYFTEGSYSDQVIEARREFAEKAGAFDQATDDFEMKMSQFIDWYLFVRPLNPFGKPPVQAVEESELELSAEDKALIPVLQKSRHSIFEFQKMKGNDLYVKDLFTGEKITIKDSDFSMGFNREEYFEARLMESEDSLQFGPSFCFHPDKATRFILKEVKRVKKIKDEESRISEKEDVIAKLFRMKYKLQQYKHVKINDIYSNEPKLRL